MYVVVLGYDRSKATIVFGVLSSHVGNYDMSFVLPFSVLLRACVAGHPTARLRKVRVGAHVLRRRHRLLAAGGLDGEVVETARAPYAHLVLLL